MTATELADRLQEAVELLVASAHPGRARFREEPKPPPGGSKRCEPSVKALAWWLGDVTGAAYLARDTDPPGRGALDFLWIVVPALFEPLHAGRSHARLVDPSSAGATWSATDHCTGAVQP